MARTTEQPPQVPIEALQGDLPRVSIDSSTDPAGVASSCLAHLPILQSAHLTDDAIWRDLCALTGTYRTFFGASRVAAAWEHVARQRLPFQFQIVPESSDVHRIGPEISWVQARFTFGTQGRLASECSGILGLVPDSDRPGQWKIWMIVTILENVKGWPNPDTLEPALRTDVLHAPLHETGEHPIVGVNGSLDPKATKEVDCVVIGAGVAGLCLAGRLQALGINYVALERNRRIGESWTLRYDSVKLHTAKDYGHLPFSRTFGPEEDYFLTAETLGRGYRWYAKTYNLNIWTSTNVTSAKWNGGSRSWTLEYDRDGEKSTLIAKHFVFAVGGTTVPIMPEYPNRDKFKGTVMHSATYRNADAWHGKRGVVIGTANTAHDVAEDMLRSGLQSITMVQRNRTFVIPISYYRFFTDPTYNADISTELSDRVHKSLPVVVTRHLAKGGVRMLASKEPERFDALERAGFKVERYGDLYSCLYERRGGHYLDVGASKKISDGLIKMKSDARVVGYTETGLAFNDGSTLDADVIIFCTGFEGNMRVLVRSIVGDDVADQLDDWWGLDAEGEIRGAWKPCGHPNIWFQGGDLGNSRYFSRFLALQIKAELEGVPFKRYTETP